MLPAARLNLSTSYNMSEDEVFQAAGYGLIGTVGECVRTRAIALMRQLSQDPDRAS